jgi:hypothetical protein
MIDTPGTRQYALSAMGGGICAALPSSVRFFRAARLLRALGRLARRGSAASPVEPARRRAVILQIDGLALRRLHQALARGDMPHLKRWLESGQARLRGLTALSAPSTPVFTAGLLYGAHAEVPGFGWYDRDLGRIVRMDLAEDVAAIERALQSGAPDRPLLDGGVSYGTIWPAGAADAFFNVVLFPSVPSRQRANVYDRLLSTVSGAIIGARVASRFVLELGVGLADFVRWCQRIRSTRFEWRFLYMRLFVSVVARDVSTEGAIVDVLRGVPVVYVNYLGYDEYAHRRGPDSEMASLNLRGIDAAFGKILRATRAVPEYGYDLFVLSDHGQSATLPFERVVGRDLHAFVLEHACAGAVVESSLIKEMVELKSTGLWARTLWRPLRPAVQLYLGWLRSRIGRRLDHAARAPLDGIEVVTGGTIAHLYFDRQRAAKLGIEEISRRWPRLVDALTHCPAIGLVVACGRRGPVVFHRGARHELGDRRALEGLEPFRVLGYEVLRRHLEEAARGARSGDLVLYGAFTEVGDVAFDFEFGSHGGVAPDELDQFVLFPSQVDFPLSGAVPAEAFFAFFRARYRGAHAAARDAA